MKSFKAQSVGVSAFVHRFGRALLSLCVLAFLATFLISVHTRPASASAPGASVTIANTPLPVTGNVNATVSGTVGISGTPNVAISNTPSVTLSGTPTVNLGSGTGTLPVTATGDPALSGFTATAALNNGFFKGNLCTSILVNPASSGQIFVVENVSGLTQLGSGEKLQYMNIARVGAAQNTYQFLSLLAPTYQVDDGTQALFEASFPMRFYFPAGVNIEGDSLATSSNDTGTCSFTVSGYLVNVH